MLREGFQGKRVLRERRSRKGDERKMTQGNPLTAIDRHGYIPAKIAERGFVALGVVAGPFAAVSRSRPVVVLHGRLARPRHSQSAMKATAEKMTTCSSAFQLASWPAIMPAI